MGALIPAVIGGAASLFGGGGNQPSSNMQQANYYQPTGQPQADTQVQGMFNNFTNPYAGISGDAQSYYSGAYNNPYALGAQNSANVSGAGYGDLGTEQSYAGNSLFNTSQAGINQADLFQAQVGQNPYTQSMIGGAAQGGQALGSVGSQALYNAGGLGGLASSYAQPLTNYAQQGAQGLQGLAQSTTAGLLPYAQQSAYSLPGLANSYAQPGNAAASSILNTAFDPQNQLYGQQFQQNQDQTRAALAARGLNSSGTGAGIENQSNLNFNTNWQNQQLGRQTQGLSAYDANASNNYGLQSSAQSQGLNSLLSAASGTFSPYSTAYGQGVSGLNTAANTGYGLQSGAAVTGQSLGEAGANDIITGAQAPYAASNTSLNDQIAQQGAVGNLAGTYGNLGSLGSSLAGAGLTSNTQAGALPYSTSTGILGNQYGALTNNLGLASQGQNYTQQQIGDLLQYLGLGTSAAQGLTNAQNTQFNQNASSAQGIGSLASSISNAPGVNSFLSSLFGGSSTPQYMNV